jgi:hypothetical protein
MSFLCEADLCLEAKAIIFHRRSELAVAISRSRVARCLHVVFDKRRSERRQYESFGGMGIVVLMGALFGRVPADQAAIVAGLLIVPPVALAIVEVVHWRRLVRRLDTARKEAQITRKS